MFFFYFQNKEEELMAIKYTVEKHTVCRPGNLIAQNYGRHIAHVNIDEDIDNGRIIKVGEMEGLDNYKKEEATAIDAYVWGQGADGLWLVVVNSVTDACTALVYQKPLIDEESPRRLTLEENFYNDPEDGPVRAYLLDSLDRFWLSADGFEGTPTKGKAITQIQNGKLKVDD